MYVSIVETVKCEPFASQWALIDLKAVNAELIPQTLIIAMMRPLMNAMT